MPGRGARGGEGANEGGAAKEVMFWILGYGERDFGKKRWFGVWIFVSS